MTYLQRLKDPKYTEIKNINSLKNMKKAIEGEVMRQKIIEFCGGKIEKTTMGYKTLLDFPLNFYKFYMEEILGVEGLKKIRGQLEYQRKS